MQEKYGIDQKNRMKFSELIDLIRWDMRVNWDLGFDHVRAILLMIEVRWEQFVYRWSDAHPNGITRLIWYMTRFFGSVFQWALCNSQIPGSIFIGRGLRLPHPQNLIFRYHAEIGEFCTIYHNVSIIWNGFVEPVERSPKIGDQVLIGANAIVIGDIVIGDGSLIGAGALVTKDMPPDSRAVSPQAVISPRRRSPVEVEIGSDEHMADPYTIWRSK
jgi:serine acetyltransferase